MNNFGYKLPLWVLSQKLKVSCGSSIALDQPFIWSPPKRQMYRMVELLLSVQFLKLMGCLNSEWGINHDHIWILLVVFYPACSSSFTNTLDSFEPR